MKSKVHCLKVIKIESHKGDLDIAKEKEKKKEIFLAIALACLVLGIGCNMLLAKGYDMLLASCDLELAWKYLSSVVPGIGIALPSFALIKLIGYICEVADLEKEKKDLELDSEFDEMSTGGRKR